MGRGYRMVSSGHFGLLASTSFSSTLHTRLVLSATTSSVTICKQPCDLDFRKWLNSIVDLRTSQTSHIMTFATSNRLARPVPTLSPSPAVLRPSFDSSIAALFFSPSSDREQRDEDFPMLPHHILFQPFSVRNQHAQLKVGEIAQR